MHTVNLREKFAKFSDYCNPRVIGELNDCQVTAVKLKGEFIKGTVRMKFRDREAIVNAGEFIIVPRGVEHLPVADEQVHILLLEPKTTLHTGNVVNERTVSQLERI